MTDSLLNTLINRLNKGKSKTLFHLRPLTDRVVFSRVWLEGPKPSDNVYSLNPYDFYFIKDESGVYIATVLDMGSNLHWFVQPKYRGKGYLTVAMKNVILYHLFQNKEAQRITINKELIGQKYFKASEKVAKSLGFINIKDDEYVLSANAYKHNSISGRNTEISDYGFNELRKKVNYIARTLWVVQTEVEMKLGDTYLSEELLKTVKEIEKHIWMIEDVWLDIKQKLL